MSIAVEIPEELAEATQARNGDLTRATVEALALEGYRSRTLSESQVKRLLGFESRIEVHAFLKEHDVHLNYDVQEFRDDLRTIREGKF